MRTLLASLNDHPMALLRGIATRRGIALTTNTRSDAASQLAAVLAEPGATEHLLGTLSPHARIAWEELCRSDGRMKTPTFTRSYGAVRSLGPGKLERDQPWNAPANATEELWFAGLIFKGFGDTGDGLVEFIYIPPELLSGCTTTARVGAALNLAVSQPPERRVEARNSLAVDAVTLLAALRGAPVRVDSEGRPRSEDQKRLASLLLLQDATRRDLLLALLRQLGAVSIAGGRLITDEEAAQLWLRQGVWPQRTALFRAWSDNSDVASGGAGWNDLRHVPGLRAEGNWRNDPLAARRAVIGRLSRLSAGEWYDLPAFVAAIKAEDPDFQRPDANYSDWYLRDAESGRFLSGFESWDSVEGRLIHFLITGPLYWLGAVSLGLADDEAPQAFSLTADGLAWMGTGDVPDPPRPARLAIQDDLTIVAPLETPLLDRFRLLRFTEPIAAATTDLPEATRHRITRESLSAARTGGMKAQPLLRFLDQASGGHVPQRLVAGLDRWDQHSGTVRLSRGAVLRVKDAHILALLRADPVVRPLLGDLLSAQAVLVNEANLPRVVAALRELGYEVKVD